MKYTFCFIFSCLILIACGGGDTNVDTPLAAEPEATNTDFHHAEDAENNEPTAQKKPNKETSKASNYEFESERYQYKDGHLVLTWEELARVQFREEYNKEVEEYILYPVFSDTLKALDGMRVMVEGFVIPFEETGDETFIVLSGLPYMQCFFCGGAGPETVIDILPKGKIKKRLKTDQKLTFKGKLRLNADDLQYLNYILDDAELTR